MMRILLILLVFQSAWAQTPELNVKVVDFALKNLDTKVGKGICWELVYEALAANKATLGDTVCYQEAKPGDIYIEGSTAALLNGYAKLEDFKKEYGKYFGFKYFERMAKGRDSIPNIELLGSEKGHIAIVYKVLGNGKFLMLEQNVGKNKRQSRVVISKYEAANYWFDDKKSKPILGINRTLMRPAYGTITQEMVAYFGMGKVSWMTRYIKLPLVDMYNLFTRPFLKEYDPYAPQPGYLLGDLLNLSNLVSDTWSCEDPGP